MQLYRIEIPGDPVGEKVAQLSGLAEEGYEVAAIVIQVSDEQVSIERVLMQSSQGGHDVPDEKLLARFGRTRANLQRAIEQLPHVIVFDNSDLAPPYRHTVTYRHRKAGEGEGN